MHRVPVVLMTLKGDGVTVSGSARSTDNVNIFAVLTRVKDYLAQFGGHAQAAGLSCELTRCEDVLTAIRRELSAGTLTNEGDILVDLELPPDRIGMEIYEKLRLIAPFGEGFARPVFCSTGVHIVDCQQTANGKHIRFNIKNGDRLIPAIWWNHDNLPASVQEVDLIYTIGVNHFQGNTTLQLEIVGMLDKVVATKREIIIEDRRYLPGTSHPQ